MPRYSRGSAPKAQYKVFTKLQLIKKLKRDGFFNYEFVKELDVYSDYVYERGSVFDIYDLTERGESAAFKRIEKVLADVMEEFPETTVERNRKAEYNYILEKVNRYFNEDDVQAVTTLLTSMLKEAPLEDLELFEFGNLKFKTTGEEYISISVGASVWSFYVEGSVEINGELYSQEPISYKPSKVNRL